MNYFGRDFLDGLNVVKYNKDILYSMKCFYLPSWRVFILFAEYFCIEKLNIGKKN